MSCFVGHPVHSFVNRYVLIWFGDSWILCEGSANRAHSIIFKIVNIYFSGTRSNVDPECKNEPKTTKVLKWPYFSLFSLS